MNEISHVLNEAAIHFIIGNQYNPSFLIRKSLLLNKEKYKGILQTFKKKNYIICC